MTTTTTTDTTTTAPSLILVRGLPGTGKSTLAALLSGSAPALAADDYFMVGGEYRFDPNSLGHAHAACQHRTREALPLFPVVVVANTFSQRWELEPYFIIAREHGAKVHVIDLFDAGLDDAALAARNVHGVPEDKIALMRARWEHEWRTADPRPPWERPAEIAKSRSYFEATKGRYFFEATKGRSRPKAP